ncbi:hypothetical protein [Bradyrhizobium sp. SZCCHNR1093]|uniref:hypothetical protein n=1 Tax=Bradyrhizobium sp. SZCCHNR1093 TaxID=3057368 RepID=UPI0028E5B676|nr:hypothetical protein [Bradyrhizobium sp. SZCCHNR1093]
MKDLFEIPKTMPSVRGLTFIENGRAINGLGEIPAINQFTDGDKSGLPSWFPSAPLGRLSAGRDPFGPIPHAPNNQGPPTNIEPLMVPDQPGLPQWMPSGPMAASSRTQTLRAGPRQTTHRAAADRCRSSVSSSRMDVRST